MPLLLALILNQRTSSPQMMRKLGFLSAAPAGLTAQTSAANRQAATGRALLGWFFVSYFVLYGFYCCGNDANRITIRQSETLDRRPRKQAGPSTIPLYPLL